MGGRAERLRRAAVGVPYPDTGAEASLPDRIRASPWSFWRKLLPPEEAPASAEAPVPGGHEAILFVDDEASLRDAAGELLRGLGYAVTTCDSGAAALDTLRRTPDHFALVVTDLTMPEMDGIALARAVREVAPDLPVVLCTGHAREVGVFAAQDAGISEFFVKPLETEGLGRLVRRVLDDSAARGEG